MDYADIIKTDIVNESWNVFWQGVEDSVNGLEPKDTLVLSIAYLPGSTEETLLQKMLQACKLEPGQYNTMLLQPEQQIAWHQLRDKLSPKKVFLVGILPVHLGISAFFRLNEPNHFNDCIFIPTISLNELEKQPEMRKQLWENGLKPAFLG
jgi:hypothetical protein